VAPDIPKSLHHTTAAFSTAFAPASPGFELAIHWTWVIVATLQLHKRQALCATLRLRRD